MVTEVVVNVVAANVATPSDTAAVVSTKSSLFDEACEFPSTIILAAVTVSETMEADIEEK